MEGMVAPFVRNDRKTGELASMYFEKRMSWNWAFPAPPPAPRCVDPLYEAAQDQESTCDQELLFSENRGPEVIDRDKHPWSPNSA